jgi:hypothetical protein
MGVPVRYLAQALIGVGGCGVIVGVAFLAARRWARRLGVDGRAVIQPMTGYDVEMIERYGQGKNHYRDSS